MDFYSFLMRKPTKTPLAFSNPPSCCPFCLPSHLDDMTTATDQLENVNLALGLATVTMGASIGCCYRMGDQSLNKDVSSVGIYHGLQ
jgi:hypothetical protein